MIVFIVHNTKAQRVLATYTKYQDALAHVDAYKKIYPKAEVDIVEDMINIRFEGLS